jgi:hypothetical protein
VPRKQSRVLGMRGTAMTNYVTTLGVTGTRDGVTDAQRAWVYSTFEDGIRDGSIRRIHHGACTGADEFVHEVALESGVYIDVWPPVVTKYLAGACILNHPLVTVHPPMPYLNRDREVVKGGTAGLIALPRQDSQPPRESWGGTWYTVDFAERLGRNVVICYPNGKVEKRLPLQAGGR